MKIIFHILSGLLPFFACMHSNAQLRQIPDLRFTDTENNSFTRNNIPPETALMLIYFRTDCDGCRHMARLVRERADDYPLLIWMVSPDELEILATFEYMTGLLHTKNVQVLQDSRKMMHQWFSFRSLPYIVLFNKNGQQLETFEALPAVATVKKILGG